MVNYVTKNIPLRTGKGKVINVGLPQLDRANMNSTQMIVDATIEIDGKTRTYTVPESQNVAYAPDIIISTDKECIMRELEAMRSQAEEALSKVEYYNDVKAQASELLAELNPVEKEKRETEARMASIEAQIASMADKFSEFMKNFNKR